MADVTLKALLLGDDASATRALRGVAKEIDKVIDRLVFLGQQDATPEVHLETAKAQRELAALQARMELLGNETERVGKRAETSHKQMGALATAILAIGPTLGPLAAGAAGLAAGFGAMGAAGVLAIVGIKQQMAANTVIGKQYSASLVTLNRDLSVLGAVAAAGVLKPFQGEVARLQTQMPALTRIIADQSVITGHFAANITNGLVTAFVTLEPLMRDVGVYALQLSQRFQSMMTGQGLVAFGDYARSVLPQVLATIESLVTSAVHLVAAFAPLGMGTLSTLRLLSDLLSAIPVDILSTIATLAGSVFLGFRAWQGLTGLIAPLSSALVRVGVSAETAAAGVRALNIAAGAIGIAITAFSMLMSSNAEASRQATQDANDYADALRASNGAIDESIQKTAAKILQDQGAFQTAHELGVAVNDLTMASIGNADAQARVTAELGRSQQAARESAQGSINGGDAMADWQKKADTLTGAIGGQNSALQSGVQKYRDMQDATRGAASATRASTLALQSTTKATKQDEQAIRALNTAIDQLLGKELSLGQAQTQVDQATLNLTTTLKKNKGAMNQHTQAGIEDRQVIEQSTSALQQQRDTRIKEGMSVADATRKYQTNSAALLAQTGRIYGTKSAVYAYMKQLLAVPTKVNTIIRANAGQAISATQAVLNNLAAIHNKSVDVTVNYLNAANKPKIGSNADGTANWRGGLTWVGERGPELMDLPAGTRIWSHTQSASMIASGSGSAAAPGAAGDSGQPIVLQTVLDGRVIHQSLVKLKRTSGGALGLA